MGQSTKLDAAIEAASAEDNASPKTLISGVSSSDRLYFAGKLDVVFVDIKRGNLSGIVSLL
jgi:hypothetical protein